MSDQTAVLEAATDAPPQTGPNLMTTDDAEVVRAVRKAFPNWQTKMPTVDQVQAIDGRGRSRALRLYGYVQIADLDGQTVAPVVQSAPKPKKPKPVEAPAEPAGRVQVPAPKAAPAVQIPPRPRQAGRIVTYIGAWLGGLGSIAANVGHSYVAPKDAGPDWSPETGSVIGAMFWPIAVLVAVEIFARVDWPAGRRWVALRFGGLLPVAIVAAVVSYLHLSGLLTHWGEDGLTSRFGPLAVDGLMVMATGALIALGRARNAQSK